MHHIAADPFTGIQVHDGTEVLIASRSEAEQSKVTLDLSLKAYFALLHKRHAESLYINVSEYKDLIYRLT